MWFAIGMAPAWDREGGAAVLLSRCYHHLDSRGFSTCRRPDRHDKISSRRRADILDAMFVIGMNEFDGAWVYHLQLSLDQCVVSTRESLAIAVERD